MEHIVINSNLQKAMIKFFIKTSVPKMLKEKKEIKK